MKLILTNSSVGAIEILPLSLYIKSTEIILDGQSVYTENSNGYANNVEKTLFMDSSNFADQHIMAFSGHPHNSRNFCYSETINSNVKYDFVLKLHNPFSNVDLYLNMLTKNGSEVIYRVNFNDFLSDSNDDKFTISDIMLKVKTHKITESSKIHLKKQPHFIL